MQRTRLAHRLTLALTLTLAATAGCASQPDRLRAPAQQPIISEHSKKLYALGEQRYAEGAYGAAVALWRQVFLQLPSEAAGDELRHKLVARMAHALTRDYLATGSRARLTDAQRLLERYLAKHEELFGDARAAVKQRWELVGALVEIEQALEAHDARVPPRSTLTDATPKAVSARRYAPRASSAREPSRPPPRSAPAPVERAPVIAGEDGVRVVKVGTPEAPRHKLGFIDNPTARAFFLSPGVHGASAVGTARRSLTPPRVIVRVGALQVRGERLSAATRRDARLRARGAVLTLRPALERCFEQAMGRARRSSAEVTVDFTIQPDGRVARVLISEGVLLDADGDLCLLEAFEQAEADGIGARGRIAARVPLTMLFQGRKSAPGPGASPVQDAADRARAGKSEFCNSASQDNGLDGDIAGGFKCGN